MSFTGHILDGQVVVDSPVQLPNGTEVTVAPKQSRAATPVEGPAVSFYERYKEFVGCLDHLPEDASVNHDYYLYGAPKKVVGSQQS